MLNESDGGGIDMTKLTSRFEEAVAYAREAHDGQTRKGGSIPYLYHLMAVSSLVLEFGGDEDQAIAGLLHDVIEDCGERHQLAIRERFGDRVATIVQACTDGTQESKARPTSQEAKYRDWLERKLRYVRHLRGESEDCLLVSGCDKLHNARAILQDLRDPSVGQTVFSRFTGGRDGTLRYYYTLAEIFERAGMPMARELRATVDELYQLANVEGKLPLSHGVYQLKVYDNFHYADESEAYVTGCYPTSDSALAAARGLVDQSLAEAYKPGMSPEDLLRTYRGFGDDPVVLGDPAIAFSAWTYASERVETLVVECGKADLEAGDSERWLY